MLRPPNPLLANDTVTLTRLSGAVGLRAGLTEQPGGTVSYPAIVTKGGATARKDDDGAGAVVAVVLWTVMLFASADPSVQTDDLLTTSGGRTLKALGPSYPRSTGAYQVECQEVR